VIGVYIFLENWSTETFRKEESKKWDSGRLRTEMSNKKGIAVSDPAVSLSRMNIFGFHRRISDDAWTGRRQRGQYCIP
jgi:hypothetical protein